MAAAKPNSPFDIMRRALVLTLLYMDDLHAFGWDKDEKGEKEERFEEEFQREVGITPREFMLLQGQIPRPQTARCQCGLCAGRRQHPRELNIWIGKQAAAIAFGEPVKAADLERVKTHHRSCALRKDGKNCSC
jgi:hypothetical protein